MEDTQSNISTNIAITPALRDRLDHMAAEQDRSRSWIAEKAIREYLDRHTETQQQGDAQ